MIRKDSGFALLLVFLLSATIAIMLYSQLPRAAFEAQRMKEEMLIERGEEYVRAIQLYTARWKKYPQDMNELEGTNGMRFLRHRYKDPMTGKDEWRLLHIDAAGVLTDSKVKKKEEKKPNQNTFISESVGIGQEPVSSGTAAANVGLRKRDSDKNPLPVDGSLPGAPPPNGAPSGNSADPGTPLPPNSLPPGYAQGPDPQGQGFSPPSMEGQPQQRPMQQFPGQELNGPPQQPPPSVANSIAAPIYPTAPATQRTGTQPGAAPASPPNAALDMIGKILTSPSPNPPAMQNPGAPGMVIGGGVAGVASKMEQGSIKLYNERQRYDEWEFVYDIKKDKRLKAQLNQMNTGAAPTGLTPTGGLSPAPQTPSATVPPKP